MTLQEVLDKLPPIIKAKVRTKAIIERELDKAEERLDASMKELFGYYPDRQDIDF